MRLVKGSDVDAGGDVRRAGRGRLTSRSTVGPGEPLCVCGPHLSAHLSVHLSADAVRGQPSALVSSPGGCEAPPPLGHRRLHAVSGLRLRR